MAKGRGGRPPLKGKNSASASASEREEKHEETDLPRYRDRAKERREDQNPDYEPTELGSFHAVAPPGGVDLRIADAQKISIENSKYLGGDVEHTHLVKGLDYALLNKIRSEHDKKPDAGDVKDGRSRPTKEDRPITFRTSTAKSVYKWIVKPQSINKINEMFLPGRMTFIYNIENNSTHDIPTTLHRSRADCPVTEETVTVGVDASVLDRIAKIMTYLRLGSSGKVLKKKKKEKDSKGKIFSTANVYGEDDMHIKSENATSKYHTDNEVLPPPPPLRDHINSIEKQSPVARIEEDDIFVGEGVDYSLPCKDMSQSPILEDMEESPRTKERRSYFNEPVYGPVPPTELSQTWQPSSGYDAAAIQAQAVAAGYQGDWQNYQYAEQYTTYPEQYLQQQTAGEFDPVSGANVMQDPYFMTQEEKDRGLGSVFKRDDLRLQQLREKDAREKDPNFISESYSECYPGYQEYNREVVDSDDEADLSKMDTGGRAKGRLHRWDFETEEEWATYNEQKEAMPKAAFQFGVKMQDGRKTRKQNKDQKLSNELHQINKILARKKGEGNDDGDVSGGGGDNEDSHHAKKFRV